MQNKNAKGIQPWERGLVPLAMVAIVIIVLFATSCSPKVINHYIYQRDTTYISKVQVDSIFQKDSVFIREKGDTIYIYKEKFRDNYKYIHDTIDKSRVDSVFIEHEKVIEVEKELNRWQKAKLESFCWLVGALCGCLVWIFRKPLWKLIKRIFV